MSKYNAVENTNDLVLIKDNKIIGTVKAYAQKGNDFISVVMNDDATKALIPTDCEMLKVAGFKHTTFRYFPFTGEFQSIGWLNDDVGDAVAETETVKIEKIFSNTRIVSKHDLEFGFVPDTFKDVIGYGIQLTENTEMNTKLNTVSFEHSCANGTTFSADRGDLESGVKVKYPPNISDKAKAQDLISFGAWHKSNIRPQLSGFRGYDCVNLIEV